MDSHRVNSNELQHGNQVNETMSDIVVSVGKRDRFIGAIAYVGFCLIIPLLSERQSAFIRFHDKQAIIILISAVILTVSEFCCLRICSLFFSVLQLIEIKVFLATITLLLLISLVSLGFSSALNGKCIKII